MWSNELPEEERSDKLARLLVLMGDNSQPLARCWQTSLRRAWDEKQIRKTGKGQTAQRIGQWLRHVAHTPPSMSDHLLQASARAVDSGAAHTAAVWGAGRESLANAERSGGVAQIVN